MRPLIAKEARNGSKLITEQDIESNVHRISDAVRDKENINIHRIEKYFEENAWLSLLAIMEKKEKCKWTCLKCKARKLKIAFIVTDVFCGVTSSVYR